MTPGVSLNKKFNRGLYESDDLKTKLVVIKFLESYHNWKLTTPLEEQPEVFKAWDFFMDNRKGESVPIEVEFVFSWTQWGRVQTGWPNLSVPYRKKDSKAKYIFRVNRDLNTIAMTTLDAVHKSPLGNKPTKNPRSGEVTNNEPFFMVSFDRWIYYSKVANNDVWREVDRHGTPVKKN